jgi:hypothetical protein
MNGWAAVLARDYPGGRLQRQETPGPEAGPVHPQIFPLQGETNINFSAFFLISPAPCQIPVRFFLSLVFDSLQELVYLFLFATQSLYSSIPFNSIYSTGVLIYISERNKIDTQSRADTYIRRKRLISKSDYNLKSRCT